MLRGRRRGRFRRNSYFSSGWKHLRRGRELSKTSHEGNWLISIVEVLKETARNHLGMIVSVSSPFWILSKEGETHLDCKIILQETDSAFDWIASFAEIHDHHSSLQHFLQGQQLQETNNCYGSMSITSFPKAATIWAGQSFNQMNGKVLMWLFCDSEIICCFKVGTFRRFFYLRWLRCTHTDTLTRSSRRCRRPDHLRRHHQCY